MLISKLIEELQALLKEHGDIAVHVREYEGCHDTSGDCACYAYPMGTVAIDDIGMETRLNSKEKIVKINGY